MALDAKKGLFVDARDAISAVSSREARRVGRSASMANRLLHGFLGRMVLLVCAGILVAGGTGVLAQRELGAQQPAVGAADADDEAPPFQLQRAAPLKKVVAAKKPGVPEPQAAPELPDFGPERFRRIIQELIKAKKTDGDTSRPCTSPS
jgi:hypothetical protein